MTLDDTYKIADCITMGAVNIVAIATELAEVAKAVRDAGCPAHSHPAVIAIVAQLAQLTHQSNDDIVFDAFRELREHVEAHDD